MHLNVLGSPPNCFLPVKDIDPCTLDPPSDSTTAFSSLWALSERRQPLPAAPEDSTAILERNQNQSQRKTSGQGKQHQRPGTADSAQFLLAHAQPSAGAGTSAAASSFVYTHYQHSLNSLHDILDRDDRASLAELHQYLNDGPSPYWDPDAEGDTPLEFAPTRPKGVRRRSLPARTSIEQGVVCEHRVGVDDGYGAYCWA